MDVIAVIDVQHGIAVAANQGRRADYRALKTPLAEGSDPVAVALGLRSLFAFPILYIADLDGIEGRGRDAELPRRLAEALPGVELWIDDGAPAVGAMRNFNAGVRAQGPRLTAVVGSESIASADDLEAMRGLPPSRYVLSLDFQGEQFAGPAAVLEDAAHWPDRVIVMTLARVGAREGPDLSRVAEVVARAGARRVYAAGGVRDANDLEALRRSGGAGALVATALHAGTITAGDLEMIAGR